jgi:hypothetical protein
MTVPMVSKFRDSLRKAGRSSALVRKVLVSLGSLMLMRRLPSVRMERLNELGFVWVRYKRRAAAE